MSENQVSPGGATGVWERHEQMLSQFEVAWKQGRSPIIDDFLPPGEPDRLTLLAELVRADLECRLRAGHPATIEEYLRRYPEIAESHSVVLALIQTERECRERQGDVINMEDYLQRFPDYLPLPYTLQDAAGGSLPSDDSIIDDPQATNRSSHRPHVSNQSAPQRPELPVVGAGASPPSDDSITDDPLATARSSHPPHMSNQSAPQRPELPVVAGFELLGVLGRGAMGVVYQARQTSLKRLVALKMIMSGSHASEGELGRFQVEAEAAARLQHPNIVQVHEIGTQRLGGSPCPYVVLEYLDGGTLAHRIAGKPQSPERAAELIAILARAMHHAHQRGIVHRDLKPANVLFTVDGTPKVADFGLAKKLDGDSLRTASGAIMGTPCYMAPEQATGRTKEIGPLADVYAMGAILYELLVGRPPFLGGSVIETLEQVRSREPVRPSRLRPGVPRDLETVCLKCLAKEPLVRYPNALELAEDLDRFRAGEAVRARRQGPLGKLVRRVRRHPWRVVVIFSIALIVASTIAMVFHFQADSRVGALQRSARDGIERLDRTEEGIEAIEQTIAELERLDAAAAETERERLASHLGQVIGEDIKKSRLSTNEEQRISAAIERLGVRSPTRATELRRNLEDSLSSWHEVLLLESPFSNLHSLVDLKRMTVHGDEIESQPSTTTHGAVLPLRESSSGNVSLQAVFTSPSWEAAERIGLALNAGPTQEGYTFTLMPAEPPAGVSRPTTLGGACAAGSQLRFRITRNGQRLLEQAVQSSGLAGRSIRFQAGRVGDLLTCQLDNQLPLKFQDPFPLGTHNSGFFGLVLSPGVRLSRLAAERQVSAIAPSLMEKGDDLFARGEFDRAADFYRREVQAAGDRDLSHEAAYKEGRCLIALRNPARAVPLLNKVSASRDKRWATLADCQLWLLHLQSGDEESKVQARLARDRLAARGLSFEQLNSILPDDVRIPILLAQTPPAARSFVTKPNQLLVEKVRDGVTVIRLLGADTNAMESATVELIKACRTENLEDEAIDVIRAYLRDHPALDARDSTRQVVDQFAWIKRRSGRDGAEEARKMLDHYLFHPTNPAMATEAPFAVGLLPEKARTLSALGEWAAAEAAIDRCLDLCGTKPGSSLLFCDACLIKGFLREQAGDNAGARQAWQRGAERYKATASQTQNIWALSTILNYAMMASLVDHLDVNTAATVRKRFLEDLLGKDLAMKYLVNQFAQGQPPEVYSRMWQSKRGRDIARQIALRDVSYADYFRLPLFLNVATTLHLMTVIGTPSNEQEQLVWDLVRTAYDAYSEGRLKWGDMLQLGLPFLNPPTLASLDFLPRDPGLRSPLAYVFGLRYQLKRGAKKAEPYFTEALKGAEAEHPSARLAAKLAAKELARATGQNP